MANINSKQVEEAKITFMKTYRANAFIEEHVRLDADALNAAIKAVLELRDRQTR